MNTTRLLLVSFVTLATSGIAVSQSATLSLSTREALYAVLDEERYAKYAYEVVLETYPQALPFAHLVQAEAQHESALIRVMRSYNLTIPDDRWGSTAVVAAPATIDDAFILGIAIEREDITLITTRLRGVREQNVRQVFTNLRSASVKHLAALRGDNGQAADGLCNFGGYGSNLCDGSGPNGANSRLRTKFMAHKKQGAGTCDGSGPNGVGSRGKGAGVCVGTGPNGSGARAGNGPNGPGSGVCDGTGPKGQRGARGQFGDSVCDSTGPHGAQNAGGQGAKKRNQSRGSGMGPGNGACDGTGPRRP